VIDPDDGVIEGHVYFRCDAVSMEAAAREAALRR
jgi:hypothetical protein